MNSSVLENNQLIFNNTSSALIVKEVASNYNKLTFDTNNIGTKPGLSNALPSGLVTDSMGNIYICGTYTSSTSIYNLDGSLSSLTLPVIGSASSFLIKYDQFGVATAWTYFKDIEDDILNFALKSAICVGSNDSIYWVSSFTTTSNTIYNFSTNNVTSSALTFTTGASTLPGLAIIKYDSSGNFLSYNRIDSGFGVSFYISSYEDSIILKSYLNSATINVYNFGTVMTTVRQISVDSDTIFIYKSDNFYGNISFASGAGPGNYIYKDSIYGIYYSLSLDLFNVYVIDINNVSLVYDGNVTNSVPLLDYKIAGDIIVNDNGIYMCMLYDSSLTTVYSFNGDNSYLTVPYGTGVNNTLIVKWKLDGSIDKINVIPTVNSGYNPISAAQQLYSGLSTDNNLNLYILGGYTGTTSLYNFNQLTTSSYSLPSGSNACVIIYDKNDNLKSWTVFNGTYGSLSVSDQIYVSGFYSTIQPVYNISTTLSSVGYYVSGPMYVIKWNINGTLDYLQRPVIKNVQEPSETYDTANKIYVDGSIEYTTQNISPNQNIISVINPPQLTLIDASPILFDSSPISVTSSDTYTFCAGTYSGYSPKLYNKDGSFSGSMLPTTEQSAYIIIYNNNGSVLSYTTLTGCNIGNIFYKDDTLTVSGKNNNKVYIYDFGNDNNAMDYITPSGSFIIQWSSQGKYINKVLFNSLSDTSGFNLSNFNTVNSIVLSDCFNQNGTKLVGSGILLTQSEQGRSVSIYGDTLAVGGSDDNNGVGATWIFTRSNGTWTQQAKLIGSGVSGLSLQGKSVSLYGDTLAVGGPGDATSAGATWIFTRNNGTWTQQGAKLVGSGTSGTSPCNQGSSVSLYKDTLSIGGSEDNNSIGAAWIFTRSNGTWTQQGTKLVGSGTAGTTGTSQGISISLYDDTLAVGGYTDNDSIGATWIFTRNNGTWTQQGNKLVGSGTAGGTGSYQGSSVSLYKNTLAVGGFGDDTDIGATWIFTRNNGTWTQQGAKLVGSGTNAAGSFQGRSVSVYENTLAVGGHVHNNVGATWIFSRNNEIWTQQGSKLVGSGTAGTTTCSQGYSISLYKNALAIGGFGDANNVGATWIFDDNTTGIYYNNSTSLIRNFKNQSIIKDSANNLYISGIYTNTTNVNNIQNNPTSSPLTMPNATSTNNLAIIKWNSSGAAQSYIYVTNATISSLCSDPYGNVYGAGIYNGAAVTVGNFAGSATYNVVLPTVSVPTAFIIKWSGSGINTGFTTLTNNLGNSINLMYNNGLYLTSTFRGAVGVNNFTNGTYSTVPANSTGWATTASMNVARMNMCGALLSNGSYLVINGQINSSTNPTLSCEIFSNESWTTTGSTKIARIFADSRILQDGTVLLSGGSTSSSTSGPTSSCEIYRNGVWNTTGSMSVQRLYHGSIVLRNGNVLVAGGQNNSNLLSSAEIYDTFKGIWSTTGSMSGTKSPCSLVQLNNGDVLAVGGSQVYESYNVTTGSWTTLGSFSTILYRPNITKYNERIFINGGYTTSSFTVSTGDTYVYKDSFMENINTTLATGTSMAVIQPMANGSILLAGGYTGSNIASNLCYIYGTSGWVSTANLTVARARTVSSLLRDGRVLVVGGTTDSAVALSSTEVYYGSDSYALMVKWSDSGVPQGFYKWSGAYKAPYIDTNFNLFGTFGSDIPFTNLYNTTTNTISNILGAPDSSVYTKWTNKGYVDIGPYSQDLNLYINGSGTIKRVITSIPNYNYSIISGPNINKVAKSTLLYYDGTYWS